LTQNWNVPIIHSTVPNSLVEKQKMQTKRFMNWGLIGASTIAKQHMVAAIRAHKGNEVRAIASGSLARAQSFAEECQITAAYSSVPELLADPTIDAVYISTTNELHHSQVLLAAAAGKHILCEKPLALNVGDAIEMVQACRAAGVVMATNHHLRNAASHRKMKELISSGAIGKVLFARVFHAVYLPPNLQGWRLDKPSAGGGVILDISVHDIDTLRFTLNAEPVKATGISQSASLAKAGLEDGVMGIVEFDNGTLVQIHDAFTVKHADTGIEYHGEKGSIFGRNVMTQQPIGSIELRTSEGTIDIPIEHENLYARGIQLFNEAIAGNSSPAATDEDGVRSLMGALALSQACRTGITQTIPRVYLKGV
jgi:1,5-anhydro-D-fructose reductase (1,5-anhydro-D-mannitol-forming)